MNPAVLRLAFAWLLLLWPSSAAAQQPAAEELIEAYVRAIGGREAHLGHASIVRSGTLEMPALNVQGEFEIRQQAPGRTWMRTSLPGIGELLTGFDGEVGWSVDPVGGPVLMQGAELTQARERASFLAAVRDTALVRERQTTELTEVEGRPCWTVRLLWASGRETLDCYSTEDGLLVASEDTQATQTGSMRVISIFFDYRDFNGMLLPTRLVQKSMGVEKVLTIRDVQVDVLDPPQLDPPAAITELRKAASGL